MAGEETGRMFKGELVHVEWAEVADYFAVQVVPDFAATLNAQAKLLLGMACDLTGRPNPYASDTYAYVSGG